METKNKTSDYSQGKIYKIICNKTGLVYIGSTCKTLDERLKRHEDDMNRFIHTKKYNPDKLKKISFCTSFLVLLNKDYKIALIENYPCEKKLQLEIKECDYMKLYSDSVNIARRPIGSTSEQYGSVKYDHNKQRENIKQLFKIN
jgi:predicted GIY-YIG superfamily endonuclease